MPQHEGTLQSTIFKCNICTSKFDREVHIPLLICTMHHTICKDCKENLQVDRLNCPFCRQVIHPHLISVNQYIKSLLPEDVPTQNCRKEVPQHFLNGIFQFSKEQSPEELSEPPLNYRAPQFVYPEGYRSVPREERLINHDPERQLQRYPENQAQILNENKNQLIILQILIHIPFAVCNVYFALTAPRSKCMDYAGRQGILQLRLWLFMMGLIEVTQILSILLVIVLNKKGCLNSSLTRKILRCAKLIAVVKAFLWCSYELLLYAQRIVPYCSNAKFAYGTILTVVHVILLSLVFCGCLAVYACDL